MHPMKAILRNVYLFVTESVDWTPQSPKTDMLNHNNNMYYLTFNFKTIAAAQLS